MPSPRPSHKPLWKTFLQVAAALVLPVFLALKLSSAIGWSWWWVMSPLWLIVVAAIVIGVAAAGTFTLVKWFMMARAWVRFRRSLLPELALADPAVLSRIEAERAVPPRGDDPVAGPPA